MGFRKKKTGQANFTEKISNKIQTPPKQNAKSSALITLMAT